MVLTRSGAQQPSVAGGYTGCERLRLRYGEGPCVPVSRGHHSLQMRHAGPAQRRLTKPYPCSGVGS
jgi:hypothetical protein